MKNAQLKYFSTRQLNKHCKEHIQELLNVLVEDYENANNMLVAIQTGRQCRELAGYMKAREIINNETFDKVNGFIVDYA